MYSSGRREAPAFEGVGGVLAAVGLGGGGGGVALFGLAFAFTVGEVSDHGLEQPEEVAPKERTMAEAHQKLNESFRTVSECRHVEDANFGDDALPVPLIIGEGIDGLFP
eukprot:s5345_g3.t1